MQPLQSSDLGLLATLDALLQESSVSRAGRRLGLSTPATSHALARLRERFDDPLLVRAGRRMVLTPRAEQLKPQVRRAVAEAERVFEEPETFEPRALERSFTLSVTDYVMDVIGGALDESLREEAPGVDLRFVPNTLQDAEALRRGDSDLTIGIYGDLPPELRTRPALTDRFVCAVRHDHPVIKKRLTLRQYVRLSHVQIAPRGQPGGYVDQLLADRGERRRVARAVPYFRTALEIVARSDDVLTVSWRLAERYAPNLGLRLLEPPLPLEPYTLSLVWHPRFDADPSHRWLRQRVLEQCQRVEGGAPGPGRRRLDPGDPTIDGQRSRR
jgi:DNA-binding transcriptional LysR family regulator